jgi:hypothetical protein
MKAALASIPLVLRYGREDVDGQFVGVRVIHRHELNAAVHQCGDECQVYSTHPQRSNRASRPADRLPLIQSIAPS